MTVVVRDATESHAAACAAIYAPYVLETSISFELDPPTPEEMGHRIATAQRAHAWLVLEEAGQVVGYAYAGPFRERQAYRWSCEVSVYVESGRRRTGAGRMLYEALFDRLTERGYRTAVAVLTVPNPASEGLHRAMGFESLGVWTAIGHKHGQWHDVAWLRRPFGAAQDSTADQPSEPR